jgi:tryptophan synthase alpha chain
VTGLEAALRSRLDRGGRAFVPYVTGGHPHVDASLLRALEDAGADAIEIGIPFSDPVMDGGVIQRASAEALTAGATPEAVLRMIAGSEVSVPLAVMTYVNPVYRRGIERFLDEAAASGVSGVIVPDLPVDEADALLVAARDRSIAAVLLASPGTSRERLEMISSASSGFVYCVSTYGVTGVRESLSDTAEQVVGALRALTDLPLLVGVGVGTPDQAAAACSFADGVVVGSALMDAVVRGDRPAAIELARAFRAALLTG